MHERHSDRVRRRWLGIVSTFVGSYCFTGVAQAMPLPTDQGLERAAMTAVALTNDATTAAVANTSHATPAITTTSKTKAAEQPSLQHVIALALERAPEVVVARSELETSRSAQVGAQLPPLGNPYLELLAGRGNRGVTRDVELRSSVTLPVEIAGQRGRRIAEADAWVALHAVSLEQVRAEATGAAVRAWGMVLGESRRLLALEELSESARSEYEILEARRGAGDATEQDLQLAAIELGRHRMLLEEARASVTRALGELERITAKRWDEFEPTSARAPTERLISSSAIPPVEDLPLLRALHREVDFHGRTSERLERERWSPLHVSVSGGRGDFGESRLGVGVGMSLPLVRSFQGERARAEGDRQRAKIELETAIRITKTRLRTIQRELLETRRALKALEGAAIPAAKAAVVAATELRRMGKSEYLAVLIARREVTSLVLRQLDLAEREWELLGSWVAITGKLP